MFSIVVVPTYIPTNSVGGYPFLYFQHLFCVEIFFLFRATPEACGRSQARDLIGAVAAGLRQSHSNTRSEAHLWPKPQLTARNARSLTHWARPGIEPPPSWFLVGFVSAVPRWQLLFFIFNGHACSIWKSLHQGMNPSHSYGKARSFNPLHWTRDWIHAFPTTRSTVVHFLTHCTTGRNIP